MENEKTTNHELTLNFQTAEDLNKFLYHINILANTPIIPSFELATVPGCGNPYCDDRH